MTIGRKYGRVVHKEGHLDSRLSRLVVDVEREQKGPRTLPWGTPAVIRLSEETESPTQEQFPSSTSACLPTPYQIFYLVIKIMWLQHYIYRNVNWIKMFLCVLRRFNRSALTVKYRTIVISNRLAVCHMVYTNTAADLCRLHFMSAVFQCGPVTVRLLKKTDTDSGGLSPMEVWAGSDTSIAAGSTRGPTVAPSITPISSWQKGGQTFRHKRIMTSFVHNFNANATYKSTSTSAVSYTHLKYIKYVNRYYFHLPWKFRFVWGQDPFVRTLDTNMCFKGSRNN